MVTRIFISMLFASVACGQLIVVNNTGLAPAYTGSVPTGTQSFDLADRQTWIHWRQMDYPVPITYPALVDTTLRTLVTVTGTVAQAEADLNRSLTNQFPAIARERGVDVKHEARAIRNRIASERGAAAGQGTVLLLRARVIALMTQTERQAELIEQLQERVEKLERNTASN